MVTEKTNQDDSKLIRQWVIWGGGAGIAAGFIFAMAIHIVYMDCIRRERSYLAGLL